MTERPLLRYVALLGAAAVILGAFGSHGLKARLDADALEVWRTAVLYHFLHTLALLALATGIWGASPNRWTARLWLIGVFLFSGSLYLLSTRGLHGLPVGILGPVTPLGGLALAAGWLSLLIPRKKA